MLDVVSEEDPSEESVPDEEAIPMDDEPVQHEEGRTVMKRRRPLYFDKRQQVELILVAQELSEFGDRELSLIGSDDEEDHVAKLSCIDIWEDANCLMLLMEGVLPDTVDSEESMRVRKKGKQLSLEGT
jgi:hypothetical protein